MYIKVLTVRMLLLFLILSGGVKMLCGQNPKIDSLKLNLSKVSSTVDSFPILNNLSQAFLFIDQDKSREYANTALDLAILKNDTAQMISSYGKVAQTYFYASDSTEIRIGLGIVKKGENLALLSNDKTLLAQNYNFYSNAYYYLGNLDSTYYFLAKAKKINLAIGNYEQAITNLVNIGVILSRIRNPERQIATHKELWELVPKIKTVDKELEYKLAQYRTEFGFAYADAEKYDNAHIQFDLALKEVTEKNFLDLASEVYRGLSLVYLGQEEYEKSLMYIDKVLRDTMAYDFTVADVKVYKARVYLKQDKYELAKTPALEALKLYTESGFKHGKLHCYELLKKIYSHQEEYEKALFYFEKEEALTDTIFSLTTKTRIIESSIEEEKEQKEKELAQEKVKFSKLLEKHTQTKSLTLIISLGLIVIVLIGLYWYRLYRIRKEGELKQELALNFHDNTANTINGINRLAQLIREKKLSKTEQDQELARISKMSSDALSSITDIIWSLNTEEGALKDLVTKVEEFAIQFSGGENIPLSIKIDPALNVNQKIKGNIRHQLLMILKEAIMNSIKHTYPTKIETEFLSNDKLLAIKIKNWFEEKKVAEFSTGKGLESIKKRVNSLQGEMLIEEATDFFCLSIKI